MSWAEEQCWFGLEDLYIEAEEERKQRMENALRTGIHFNGNKEQIDTRGINSKYATNLYDWYLRQFPKERHEEILTSELFKILEDRMKENKYIYRESGYMEKPTKKQLKFIETIEEDWEHNPFNGKTKEEARKYISEAIKEKERYDFENEALGYGLPNQ